MTVYCDLRLAVLNNGHVLLSSWALWNRGEELGDTDSGLRVSKGDAASRLGLGMGDEQPDQAGLKWGQDRAEHMSSKPVICPQFSLGF